MKKFIILFLFLGLTACGFEPLLVKNKLNFSLEKYHLNENPLNNIIDNRLKSLKKNKESINKYSLKINTTNIKKILSNDNEGNPSILRLQIDLDAKTYEKNELIFSKIYSRSIDYRNTKNKFELKKYEKKLQKQLMDKILSELTQDLYRLK